MHSAGHTVTDGRKKGEGLVIVVLASAVRKNNTLYNNLRSIKKFAFPFSASLLESWRTAKPGWEPVVDPMIRP